MLKVYCDFNDRTDDHCYWILCYDGKPLDEQVEVLGLNVGDRVLLYQDEDDFEVEGTLLVRQAHRIFFGEKLCALVDWPTIRRFDVAPKS